MASIIITNAGLGLIRDSLSGANNALITYVALGTSSTTPTTADTQLGTEVFRKKVTSYTNGGANGEILINCYIAPADVVGVDIEEIGFFGGGAATSTANTGVLL
ncbi:MAG: phage tail protein, partial [Ktedonobacteraceae bacterium]